jgi:hypothetical protein
MFSMTDFLFASLKEAFFNLMLYVIFGLAVFAVVWRLLTVVWRWRRIQPKSEQRRHFFSHDVLFSLGSILLAGVLTALITFLDQLGFMKLYWDFNAHSSIWGFFATPYSHFFLRCLFLLDASSNASSENLPLGA